MTCYTGFFDKLRMTRKRVISSIFLSVISSVVEKSRFLFGILRLRATRSAQNDRRSLRMTCYMGFFGRLRMTCYSVISSAVEKSRFLFGILRQAQNDRRSLRMTYSTVISSAVEKSRLYAPVMLIFIRTELASIVSLQSISQPSIQTRSVCFTLVFCAKLLTLRLHTILSDSNGCVL